MNRISILIISVFITLNSFGQHVHAVYPETGRVADGSGNFSKKNSSARITSTGDTLVLQNSPDTANVVCYKLGPDSGYVYGINYWNDQAFAEQYNVSDSDVNIQVIGVVALFGGKVNTTSSQAVTFYAWDQGPMQLITGSLYYNGFPNDILDTVSVPVTQLGIGVSADTIKSFFFQSGTGNISSSFFVGYGINYNFLALDGDTIGLYSSKNGIRHPSALYTIDSGISETGDTVADTTINVQNATFGADYAWYDNFTQYDSLYNNLIIYPIVVTGFNTGIKGITRNNFTFYGNYPNPCVNSTNIQFGLVVSEDVTIQVMAMGGSVLNTIKDANLATGRHTITVNTANMPSGDYLYLVRTAGGDGIAGKMTVIH